MPFGITDRQCIPLDTLPGSDFMCLYIYFSNFPLLCILMQASFLILKALHLYCICVCVYNIYDVFVCFL